MPQRTRKDPTRLSKHGSGFRPEHIANLVSARGCVVIELSSDEEETDGVTASKTFEFPTFKGQAEEMVVARPASSRQNQRGQTQPANRSKRSGNFGWARVHLEVLYLLRTKFKGSWDHTAEIFNEIFEQHIREQSLVKGPSKEALKTYWYSGLHAHPRWKDVIVDLKEDEYALDDLELELVWVMGDRDPNANLAPGAQQRDNRKGKKVGRCSVSEEEAHSIPSVLFRSYSDQSQGYNSPNGFIANHFLDFQEPLPAPPVHSDDALFNIVKMHLNWENFRSPFISTSDSLIRTLRRALKNRKKAADPASCRISIINSLTAGRGHRIFHAYPYRKELRRKKRSFDKHHRKYLGNNEYLIWASVPREAVIGDVSLDELLDFHAGDPVLSCSLGMDLAVRRSWKTLRKRWKRDNVTLYPELISAIARFISYLGTGMESPPAITARLVSEIVHGWCIAVPEQSSEAWIADAVVFICALNGNQDAVSETFGTLAGAFLAGVGTSSREWFSHFGTRPSEARRILRRANRLGLRSLERGRDESVDEGATNPPEMEME